MNGHGGLPVFKGGEFLGAGGGQRAVARDNFFSQAAVGFQAQRQRGYVQQQPFAVSFVARQHVCLHRRAQRNHLVGVQIVERGLPEKVGNGLLHMQHPRGAAHHNHAFYVVFADARVFQRLLHGGDGLGDQMLRERVEFAAADGDVERFAVGQGSLNVRFVVAA